MGVNRIFKRNKKKKIFHTGSKKRLIKKINKIVEKQKDNNRLIPKAQ